MPPEIEDQVLERIGINRRKFVRDVVLGTAFAVPAIASFDMRSLSAYAADWLAPNQTFVSADHRFKIRVLNFDQVSQGDVLKVQLEVHDVDTDKNVSSSDLPVTLRKVKPEPSANVGLPTDFRFRHTQAGRFYKLKLDTSHWDPGTYELLFTVGGDPTRFKLAAAVGNC